LIDPQNPRNPRLDPLILRRGIWRPTAAASSPPAMEWNRRERVVRLNVRVGGLRLQVAPVADHVRPIAVDFEPRQRFLERGPVEQGPTRSEWRVDVEQARLQRHDLMEALQVATGNRQHPDVDAPFEWIR
jgi:hypothetical protein